MKPYKIYGEENIDPAAISQFFDCMKHPAIVQGALMPDAHKGYSLPIGGVVASKGVIFPSFIGYDIGCGMCAVPLSGIHPDILVHDWEKIVDRVCERIPMGFNHRKDAPIIFQPNFTGVAWDIYRSKNGDCQLGTLGGGNHFIEIGVDSENCPWIVIHSGSRGVGHGVAEYYMKLASGTGKASEGNYGIYVNDRDGQNYIGDMRVCLEYALRNRGIMVNEVVKAIAKATGYNVYSIHNQLINRNHNHAVLRDDLWIHRKGATHAEAGMLGVIPGNSADGSFIVRGLGNPDGLYSSSHGAGRLLGRAEAKRVLKFEDYEKRMEGVKARLSLGSLDESPDAYKNIFKVMEAQKDLVEIVEHIRPIISIKDIKDYGEKE